MLEYVILFPPNSISTASIIGMSQQNLSSFIWAVADLLRGDYKQSEYGKVISAAFRLRPVGDEGGCAEGSRQAIQRQGQT